MSHLIDQLRGIAGEADRYLAKRQNVRTQLDCQVPLELKSGNTVVLATATNVSSESIGIQTKQELKPGEVVEVRILEEAPGGFESFLVKRVTRSLLGYAVGLESIAE